MKLKLIALIAAAVAAVLATTAIIKYPPNSSRTQAPAGTRTFQVHGQIRALSPQENTIRIAHDEIPHYMPAMTMSLPVKDPGLLKNLTAGDEVQFELVVTLDDSWVSHIEKLTAAAGNQAGATPSSSLAQLESECLQTGELVPDFKVTDQDGKAIHLKDFRGKAVLLTFIYTRCPLPNFCPLMSKNFAELEQRLSKEFPNQFHLLSISMDPDFDKPEVLKDYAARYGASAGDWSFGAADPESLNFVAGLMGLYFEKQGGMISHDLRTALIGPDGRLAQVWKSNVWTPYEVQRSVRELLAKDSKIALR